MKDLKSQVPTLQVTKEGEGKSQDNLNVNVNTDEDQHVLDDTTDRAVGTDESPNSRSVRDVCVCGAEDKETGASKLDERHLTGSSGSQSPCLPSWNMLRGFHKRRSSVTLKYVALIGVP